ncbi:uncharacterized protein LOC132066867 [Lycium ferocissimum]|uniref:uncharacterized protein LOC132066867 n=1 Tax=Lycium ferocissimum TaxID=112874 RepID=UPI002815F233|nr:uncharacterized protein LOC132066867 [Lycium ferocissimum]
MEAIQEDMSEGILQCTNHTYKSATPGGICDFCLQEKLGKLVSSSISSACFPPPHYSTSSNCNYHRFGKMRKPSNLRSVETSYQGVHMLEADEVGDYSHKKKGFWSFLHSSSSKHSSTAKKTEKTSVGSSLNGSIRSSKNKKEKFVVIEETERPVHVYSRSRSVGCESKISTGLADCTLRRVESQRENKHIVSSSSSSSSYCVSSEEKNGKFTRKGKSWGWVLASPMRAFSKKRDALKKNATPNLDAIPSLLTKRN